MVNQDLGKVAVVARGAYDSKVEYERLDAVTYNGSSYLVRQRCRGVTPAEGTYYMLMAQAGDSTAANTAAEEALRAAEAANAATTAANTAAASAQEVVDTVIPDVTQLKSDIRNKLTSPSGAQVGQTFRVQAVNEDGTYTLEPVAMQPERTYIKLIELTLEEDVNVIEFESQGCDEVFIFGNCKKATTKSNVYVNAIFNGTLRDIICCVNLLNTGNSLTSFTVCCKFGQGNDTLGYWCHAVCGSSTALYAAGSAMRRTYNGKIPEKITLSTSGLIPAGSTINAIGVKYA